MVNRTKQKEKFLKIEFTQKEKLKILFGIHNPFNFECWVYSTDGNRYKGKLFLDKEPSYFDYYGKKRKVFKSEGIKKEV